MGIQDLSPPMDQGVPSLAPCSSGHSARDSGRHCMEEKEAGNGEERTGTAQAEWSRYCSSLAALATVAAMHLCACKNVPEWQH
jgi:hypothetical protein